MWYFAYPAPQVNPIVIELNNLTRQTFHPYACLHSLILVVNNGTLVLMLISCLSFDCPLTSRHLYISYPDLSSINMAKCPSYLSSPGLRLLVLLSFGVDLVNATGWPAGVVCLVSLLNILRRFFSFITFHIVTFLINSIPLYTKKLFFRNSLSNFSLALLGPSAIARSILLESKDVSLLCDTPIMNGKEDSFNKDADLMATRWEHSICHRIRSTIHHCWQLFFSFFCLSSIMEIIVLL